MPRRSAILCAATAPRRPGGGKSSGGIMEKQPCTATERPVVVAAFKDGVAVAAIAPRIGDTPGSLEWPLKKARLRRNNRKRPIRHEDGDTEHAHSAQSLRKADLAFQRAMRRAVAQGREHPPMIGIFKDARPLNDPRLFEPVPHSSGCTSPALVCAEFELDGECPTIGSAGTQLYVRALRRM